MDREATLNAAALAYRAGDEKAFDVLYEALLPTARYLGRVRQRITLGPDDITQVCLITLVKATREWDPERGAPFEAYARRMMKFRAQDAAKANARAVQLFKESQDVMNGNLAPMSDALPALEDACRDNIDTEIVRGLVRGMQYSTIGALMGMTKQAVCVRVTGIKNRFQKE